MFVSSERGPWACSQGHEMSILVILLVTGAAVTLIGLTGHSKISAGSFRIDTGEIRPLSRSLIILAGVIGMLSVLAFFPSNLPTYLLKKNAETVPASASTSPKSRPLASPSVVAPTPPQIVRVYDYFFNTDSFAQGIPPYIEPVYSQVIAPAVGGGALQQLFTGPTRAEWALGLRFVSSKATGFTNLRINDGAARVQLIGGCNSGGSTFTVANEIRPTLEQFPTVDWVKIYDPAGNTEQPYGDTDSIPKCLEP